MLIVGMPDTMIQKKGGRNTHSAAFIIVFCICYTNTPSKTVSMYFPEPSGVNTHLSI